MNLFKQLFYLQRNDRQALIAVLSVMLIGITAIIVIGKQDDASQSVQSQVRQTSNGSIIRSATKQHPVYANDGTQVHEVFPFDPNTASAEDLARLGLATWQIRGILKYRSKGGAYRTPNDFARVYGMTKKQFETLLPFIRIGEDYQPAANFYGRERDYSYRERKIQTSSSSVSEAEKASVAPVYSYPHKIKAGEHIAVNEADTADLMRIPGIGIYYAKSIIRYRERLGGFVSAKQVLEVEGVPETTVGFLSVDASKVRKLEVNKLSLNHLRRHPYLNFYQAEEICDYRRKNGPIKDISELRLLKDFPPAEIERLKPYLAY